MSKNTLRLTVCAMLVALGVILGGALSIPGFAMGGYSFKIGFGVLPVILSGVLYGPIWGGMVGGLTDLIQALVFPKGPYMPWFTIVGVLFGAIPGMFFVKGQSPTWKRLALAVATGQIICSVILNTAVLVLLVGGFGWEIMIPRIINQIVMIPLYTVLVYYISRFLRKRSLV
ncbi:MAG: Folate transporter FolT [Firmicutes bacterium ADurb.Bin182]|nr:MAG: Folate transporter FolT [Firmicutes bacterium ADurb.Bin182]